MRLLVLHDSLLECTGGPWREAFERAGWQGPVLAPDLPGHGSTPPPPDGNYDPIGAAWHALRVLDGVRPDVVVGVGSSAYAARMLGLGGRAGAVVTVEAPVPPVSVTEMVADYRQWLREMSDDPAAMADPPHHHPDPRLARGAPPAMQRPEFLAKVKAALPVPVLEL